MSRLRWGDEVPPDSSAARERLIDAAERCIDRFGLAKTTLEDVATEASVSRATIYRYFSNRDELMLEVLLRELARSFDVDLADFVTQATTTQEFARAIVESSAYLLATIRGNSKLQVLLNQEGNTVAATVAGASPAFFVAVREDLRPHLEPAQRAGLLRPELDLDEASEWILRSILSLITVEGPVHRSAEDEKELLTTFLVPALVPNP
jgi:AcrR family transcriptional regulator